LITVKGNDLEIDVKNNFKRTDETERTGIGVANLEHRLRLFYPGHIMTSDSHGDEYHVNLNLKLS
jgi:LytS/YehU family sensor histidine kinase